MSESQRLTLMIVHAHPDDEAVATAGTFLRYAEEGLSTVLVCCTSGEEGEIHDPDLDPEEARPRLGEIRFRELRCAADLLKIGSLEMLGYRDSGMAGTPANQNPASFHQVPQADALQKLVRLVRRYRPSVLASYNDFGSYGHPDHIKAYEITREAFDRAADPEYAPDPDLPAWQPLKLYEVTMVREQVVRWRESAQEERRKKAAELAAGGEPAAEPEAPDPEKEARQAEFFETMVGHSTPLANVTSFVDVRAYRETIIAALRCHRSQFSPDSAFFKEWRESQSDLDNFEHYTLMRSLVKTPEREDDLFAGIR